MNINGFSPNWVCALLLWDIVERGFELLMGKFRQTLTELSALDTPIFSFPDDNLSKCMYTCIDIKERAGRVVRRCCVSYITGASN